MKHILKILSEFKPNITENDLHLPVKDTDINSIDLVVIRVALEKHFQIEVPDSVWYKFISLKEAITFFQRQSISCISSKGHAFKGISEFREYEIGMPQMSNNALSENWLLKELGDIHWKMLSKGLEQRSVDLKDDTGNRLYATFIRIQYSLAPLYSFGESERLLLEGNIKRFGGNTYLSVINGASNENGISANLMTSFTIRESNDNSRILRSNPQEKTNSILHLERMPEFLNEYRLLKTEQLNELEISHFKFEIKKTPIGSFEYDINPYYDINGVGLLYYASYPIISDTCVAGYLKEGKNLIDFETNYHTTYRDVFYFANCNVEDRIICDMFSISFDNNKKLQIQSALYRKSDRKLMAKIFTIKEKQN
ncbi:MAG: Pnap_2097 family protein [Bacteroidales bacterium]|jgi:probable biosynthetic protein (TIGR04098 family)